MEQLEDFAAYFNNNFAFVTKLNEDYLEPLSESTNISLDIVRVLFCVFLSVPLGILHRYLPTATMKHIFSFSFGFFFCWLVYGTDTIYSFSTATICYLLLLFAPRSNFHIITFIFAFGVNSIMHLYRMYTCYLCWELDPTGPQMALTLKAISVAFDLHDGTIKKSNELRPSQLNRRLLTMPTPLEYFAYIYFYPSFLLGPFFQFKDYLSFSDLSMFGPNSGLPKDQQGKAPPSWIPTIFSFFYGLIFWIAHSALASTLDLETLIQPDYVAVTPYLHRFIWTCLSIKIARFKFHGGWTMADAAMRATGLGWSGYDSKTSRHGWNRVTNIYPLQIEWPENQRTLTTKWNAQTGNFLRHYIYLRWDAKGPNSKPSEMANHMTFIVCGFWHGFYPAYYYTFLLAGILNVLMRRWRKAIRPIAFTTYGTPKPIMKPVYDFLGALGTSICYDLLLMPHMGLSFQNMLLIWSSLFGALEIIAVVIAIASPIVTTFVPRNPDKPIKSGSQQQQHGQQQKSAKSKKEQ